MKSRTESFANAWRTDMSKALKRFWWTLRVVFGPKEWARKQLELEWANESLERHKDDPKVLARLEEYMRAKGIGA